MMYGIKEKKAINSALKAQGFKNLRQHGGPTICWRSPTHSITMRGRCNGLPGDEWELFEEYIEHKGVLHQIDLDNIHSSIQSIVSNF
jgi:hypothetical protein